MSQTVLLQLLLCPVVLLALLRITAPYGRHFAVGWGPVLPNRFAWFLMELPALLVIPLLLLASGKLHELPALVPWLLWSLHYAYRTLIFPALMRPSGKNFPALLVLFGISFNTLNGYNNGQALIADSMAGATLLEPNFALGTILFLLGFWLHTAADRTIRKLRSSGFSGYGIPTGGWFDKVSNPNYLGECIQWTGWAILTWSWAGSAFALFTFCNLAPRAVANHRWYQQTFPDYPANRRVLIPWLF
jgi:3-oxo-5-alpha-steroid 4-dehydrogenase 1